MADTRPSDRIAAELRESIDNGYYAPGQQLPSTRALMARYGVANQTIQNAIDVLRTEGLIEGRRGAGLFVLEQPNVEEIVRLPCTEERGCAVERVSCHLATQADAANLNIGVGRPVLVVTRCSCSGHNRDVVDERTLFAADQYELVYKLPTG